MKNFWIIVGALGLCGCSSNTETTPETNSAAPVSNAVQPQIMATVAPTTIATPTPMMPAIADANSSLAPSTPPIDGSEQPAADDTKRQEVESLRSDMSRLQRQRSAVEQQKTDFGVRHPNARAEERATGSNFPNDARMAEYNQQLDDIDSQLTAKQKQIDDLMMSR